MAQKTGHTPATIQTALVGCLLGMAVGDALGLPFEGLSPRRGKRLFGGFTGTVQDFHLLPGHGMISDDTEHACFTAQAVIRAHSTPPAQRAASFQKHLAASLRWWLLGLPAGVGLATLRATLKLWLGFAPGKNGVYSAGNGPAMRAPLLGLVFSDDNAELAAHVLASTSLTHTDPKAYQGALAVAVASAISAGLPNVPEDDWSASFLSRLHALLDEATAHEFLQLIDKALVSARRNEPVADFAAAIGSKHGISGYIFHTVPCVVQVWLRFPKDYAGGIRELITAGGDTDTTAAILGGIIGAHVGKTGIPGDWLKGVQDWPRSRSWIERLAQALAARISGDETASAPAHAWWGVPLRNLLFLAVVLTHGFRRLLPPY